MTFPKISKTKKNSLKTTKNKKNKQSCNEASYEKKSENRQQLKFRNTKNYNFINL